MTCDLRVTHGPVAQRPGPFNVRALVDLWWRTFWNATTISSPSVPDEFRCSCRGVHLLRNQRLRTSKRRQMARVFLMGKRCS